MTIDTGMYWTSSQFNASIANQTIAFGPVDFNGSLTVISYCSLSFICHFNILPLQKELKGPVTKVKLYSMIVGSILTAYVLYNIVIFAGYFRVSLCVRVRACECVSVCECVCECVCV